MYTGVCIILATLKKLFHRLHIPTCLVCGLSVPGQHVHVTHLRATLKLQSRAVSAGRAHEGKTDSVVEGVRA